MSVTTAHLDRIEEIVSDKNWQRFDRKFVRSKTVIQSIIDMVSECDDDEIDIILNILPNYDILWDYLDLSFDLIDGMIHDNVTLADFCPVKLLSHFSTKSGQNFAYELYSASTRYKDVDYKFFDDPLDQRFLFNNRPKYIVDDFIGSGEQLRMMLAEIAEDDPHVVFSGLVVLAIQQDALEYAESRGLKVFAAHVRPKGIEYSCLQSGIDLAVAYAAYDKAENRVGVADAYKRGYRASEALISMKRTPDNTLPIFWGQGDGKWPAPFPR